VPGQGASRVLTGAVFNISEHSAGISSPQPVAAVEAQPFAAAAPDGRSGARAAAAVGPPEGVAARPFGAVAVPASPSAEPDAAAVAVVRPGVVAQPAESAAVLGASAQPAEWALKALQRVWVVAVAVEPRLAFAPLPGPELSRQLSADPPEVPAHSFQADVAAQVSRWDSARRERVRSPPTVEEAPLSNPGLAKHSLSVARFPEATHSATRWRATAYWAKLSDRMARPECLASSPD
jgi:hypothetical protein